LSIVHSERAPQLNEKLILEAGGNM
jgi:hypothetical protein